MRAVATATRRPDSPARPVEEGRIQRVNPLDDPDWDTKVAHCRGASFFHGADWARVLHDTYGYRPAYFVQEAAGRIRGLLPLMEVDSWLTGRRGVALPFTDECQPLGADDRSISLLLHEASAFAANRDWKYWELRGGTSALNAPTAIAFYGHAVELQPEPARLFACCDSAVRRAVRKAERSNVAITFSQSLEATRTFYALHCQTRRRHGVPPQPWSFFENIQRHILRPQRGCIVLANVDGRPAAGAVFFHFGNTAIFKFGASDEAHQPLRPNNLVLWRAIEWHARAGFTVLDLGRTSLADEGLRRFKLNWGARERRIEYARFDCRTATYARTPDRSAGWPTRLFKLIPPSIARLIGAAAYRHLA